jgi:hypothetical protein
MGVKAIFARSAKLDIWSSGTRPFIRPLYYANAEFTVRPVSLGKAPRVRRREAPNDREEDKDAGRP